METELGRDGVRCVFVVARDQLDLWHDLRRDFAGDQGIRVLLDRRRGERRQRAEPRERDRRRAERRRQQGIDYDLRYRSFVIIHQQQGVLSN